MNGIALTRGIRPTRDVETDARRRGPDDGDLPQHRVCSSRLDYRGRSFICADARALAAASQPNAGAHPLCLANRGKVGTAIVNAA
jgi:hypothetical protein